MKNLMKTIGVGSALVGALAGTAYGGTKEDLDAIRDYVMKHPTSVWEVTMTGFPKHKMHELKKDGFVVEATPYNTLFREIVNGKLIYVCDRENDGNPDRIVILRGDKVSNNDNSFTKMECLSEGSLDSEVSMSDMAQWGGKNPYNTRAVLDVNEGVTYDFADGTKTKVKDVKRISKSIYQKTLNVVKQALK